MTELFLGIAIVGGLGLIFGIALSIAHKKLKVAEDPRLDELEQLLPGTNCGACGQPGCRAFAAKLLAKEVQPAQCTVSSPEGLEAIADFLGVDVGRQSKRVARVLCAGGERESPLVMEYKGVESCRGAAVISFGPKQCLWGCLGLGDCERACGFDALHMNENRLPVVDPEKCTACGDCVEACPRDLIVLLPLEYKLLVQCKSLLSGDEALEVCSVACNACGRCVADAPAGTMEMRGNLPWIDYTKIDQLGPEVTWRCPTGAIVWVEGKQFVQKKVTPEIQEG